MDNRINKLISKEEIEDILNMFGNIGKNNSRLQINNIELYRIAFTNESYYQSIKKSITDIPDKIYLDYQPKESNERLEFLGDHILKSILGKYLYKRFSDEREGFLTTLKIKLEKGKALHKMGEILGFKKFILLSLQVENQTILNTAIGRNTCSFYEDCFEAFIGAIFEDYEDLGFYYAEKFVVNIIENTVDFAELNTTNDNYKDSLQRYCQTLKWKPPTYIQILKDNIIPIYRNTFTSIVLMTQEQYSLLEPIVQFKIKKYNDNFLKYFKNDSNISIDFKNKILNSKEYILGSGTGKKITESCQETAKQCLINLNIELTY